MTTVYLSPKSLLERRGFRLDTVGDPFPFSFGNRPFTLVHEAMRARTGDAGGRGAAWSLGKLSVKRLSNLYEPISKIQIAPNVLAAAVLLRPWSSQQ